MKSRCFVIERGIFLQVIRIEWTGNFSFPSKTWSQNIFQSSRIRHTSSKLNTISKRLSTMSWNKREPCIYLFIQAENTLFEQPCYTLCIITFVTKRLCFQCRLIEVSSLLRGLWLTCRIHAPVLNYTAWNCFVLSHTAVFARILIYFHRHDFSYSIAVACFSQQKPVISVMRFACNTWKII